MSFGFSYLGFLFIMMLIIPNLLWTKNRPQAYEKYADNENKALLVLERTGEILVTVITLFFADFSLGAVTGSRLWLVLSVLLMLMYEIYWVRYFRSPKTMRDFYRPFAGVLIPGATLPVCAFFLLGVYGGNLPLIIAVVILGIGHIGIHWCHWREVR